MAEKLDDYSDLGAVPLDDYSDLGAVPLESEESSIPTSDISKTDSALAGLKQGVSFGTADEQAGFVGAALDAGQQALNAIGLADPSPSQVSEKLAQEGFKGDLGPQSILEQYRQMRNEERARDMAAQKANPLSYGAGTIAGGIATTPLLPAAMLGNAAKGASLGVKVLTGAEGGALSGAAMGVGMSDADLTQPSVDNALEFGKDVAGSTLLGGTMGAAIPAVAQGAKAIGGAVVDQFPRAKTAFNIGKESGKKIDDALYAETKADLDRKSMEIIDPIMEKVNKDQATKAEQILKLDTDINDITTAAKRAEEASIAKQTAQNAQELDNINKGIVKLAKDVQQKVKGVKENISKEYDDIDSLIEGVDVFPENREVIGGMVDSLQQSNLKDSLVNGMISKYQGFLGKKDMQSYRDLKAALSKDMNSTNPEISRPARQAYFNLKNQYQQDLINSGQDGLAARLAETNKRWNAVKQIEDNFLDNVYANSATGQTHASNKTIGAIEQSVGNNAKGVASTEELNALLNTASPKVGQDIMTDMAGIAQQQQAAKNFTPQVLPQGRNPELERLQALLSQAKAEKPQTIPGIPDIPTTSPEQAQKAVQGLIRNAESKTNMTKDLTMDRLSKALGEQVGEENAKKIMQEVPDIGERVRLMEGMNKDGNKDLTMGVMNLIENNLVGNANAAGRVARKLQTPASVVKKVIPSATSVEKGSQALSTSLLTKGPTQLSKSSDEDIQSLSEQMKSMGPEGEAYSRVLEGIIGKNETSRNAIIMGLMQRPDFRELLKKMGKDQK